MALMCKAPFVSQTQWTTGTVSMCCNDSKGINLPLEEEWNCDYRKETRRQILNNEVPKRCESCLLKSSDLIVHYNENIKTSDEELIANCTPDGHMNLPPVYLHLSPTNKCQLACRMCNQNASTTFDKLYSGIVHPNISVEKEKLVDPNDVVDYVRKVASTLQEFVFHGGEPMMSPYFEDIVGSLLEVKDTIRLVILGNGMTISTPQGAKAIELMKQFKEVEFILSLDGVPEINNYQRCLSDTDLIMENVKYIRRVIPQLEFRINHTLTNISVNRITEFYDYINFHLQNIYKLHHGFVRHPVEHQVKNLPEAVRNRILTEIREYDTSHLQITLQYAYSDMRSMIEREFSLPFDSVLWSKFMKYDKEMNLVHHNNGNTFPNIWNLIIPSKTVV